VRSVTLTRLEAEIDSNAGYDKAFKTISEVVRAEILMGAKALEVSQLLKRYIDLLLEVEIPAPNYRSSKLKKRLRKAFGDNLQIRVNLN